MTVLLAGKILRMADRVDGQLLVHWSCCPLVSPSEPRLRKAGRINQSSGTHHNFFNVQFPTKSSQTSNLFGYGVVVTAFFQVENSEN